MNMNIVDILILSIIFFSSVLAILKGLLSNLVGFLGILATAYFVSVYGGFLNYF